MPDYRDKIAELSQRCESVWHRASEKLGPDLVGLSILDLMADNLPSIDLKTLKTAIAASNRILCECSPRIRSMIAAY